ncbi:MAG: NlpC/P60 family protein [Gallionella sp.]|jgi:cell wall-associated NlpC family hydrolase
MKYPATIFSVLLLSACGTAPVHTSAPQSSYTAPLNDEAQMNNLAIYAMSLHDTPYQYGGASRNNGFDCSGFVQFVFQNSLGLNLPRTSAEMGRIGTPLDTTQLKPGDLVFFNTTRSANSHVGIFIGENRFVHSPKSGKAIMITSLNEKYWRARYNGARRITPNKQFAVNN